MDAALSGAPLAPVGGAQTIGILVPVYGSGPTVPIMTNQYK